MSFLPWLNKVLSIYLISIYVIFRMSLRLEFSCIATLYESQKVFHFNTLPLNTGKANFGNR